MPSPQEWLQKWQRGMAGAGQAYQTATQAYNGESPAAMAARETQKAISNYTAVVGSQAYQTACNNSTTSYWKQQCAIGAAKLATGAQKGATKYLAGMQRVAPALMAMRDASRAAGGGEAGMIAAHQLIRKAGRRG